MGDEAIKVIFLTNRKQDYYECLWLIYEIPFGEKNDKIWLF